MELTNSKRERFCREYLIDANATQAAIRAGYSARAAACQGSRLLSNAKVRGRVDELAAELASAKVADATEVMEFLTAVMRGEIEADRSRVQCAELLAKRHGLLKETLQVKCAAVVQIIDDI